MSSVLENPAVRARAHVVSVEEYHAWIDAGLVPPKVELIRGALVEKMSQSPLHGSIVELVRVHLESLLPKTTFVRQEKPLTLEDSEPEPDLAVIQGERREFFRAHPTTAALVIEVAVSSEALDRLKAGLYAEAGVPEYWLILAEAGIVERHTEPHGEGYRQVEKRTLPGAIESTVFPGLLLPPAGVFPG